MNLLFENFHKSKTLVLIQELRGMTKTKTFDFVKLNNSFFEIFGIYVVKKK